MLNIKRRLQQLAIMLPSMLIVWLAAYQPMAWAALDISPVPLVTSNAAKPNVIFTFDDSGSMGWGYMPDEICNDHQTARARAASYNKVYYDPNINYAPGIDYTTGLPFVYPDFHAARDSGYDSSSTPRDLRTAFSPQWDSLSTNTTHFVRGNICDRLDEIDWADVLTVNPSAPPAYKNPGAPGRSAAYYYTYDGSGSVTDDTNYNRTNFSGDGGIGTGTLGTYSATNEWPGIAGKQYFNKYLAGEGSCPGPADPKNTDCYNNDQRTNFATWYSFYRNRQLAAISSAGIAFNGLEDDSIRIAYQRINSCNSGNGRLGATGTTSGTICEGTYVKLFSGTTRTNFFKFLSNSPANGGTNLRTALDRAGEYVMSTNIRNPFAKDPGATLATEASCRQNYHFMFTDGRRNGSGPGNPSGNQDNTNWTMPDGTSYTAQDPYRDSVSSTLADIAFYYWRTDLRSSTVGSPALTDDISPSFTVGDATTDYWNYKNNPATWQHMVNFTVGLGVVGSSTLPGSTTAIQDTTLQDIIDGNVDWPSSILSDTVETVDDLWHAAVNSRGQYYSAKDPASLISSFQQILNTVKERGASTAPISTNSTQLFTGSRVYQASFNSGTWYGGLTSFTTTDGINFTQEWDTTSSTSGGFNGQTNTTRKIVTYDVTATPTGSNTKGIPFQWADITTAQKNNLHDNPVTSAVDNDGQGNARLDYVRGDKSNEGAAGNKYRARSITNMGDIVNSSPIVIGPTSLVFADSLESKPHSTFRNFTKTREAIAYFGANDGMLHGIDASFDSSTNASGTDAGKEVMAYIPSMLIPKLNQLTDPNYRHKFYVDATPASGDAFGAFKRSGCGAACWGSVLVGGLGAGGKGIYALDVTDPSLYTNETNANKYVLWEYTDATDLGLTFGTPVITRVHKAGGGTQWVAIFGNGYDSTGGKAVLYIVDIVTGTLIKKIDTGIGSDNGLSSPTVVDEDGDFIFDVVYAGDLRGNLWKFNLRDPNPTNWDVAIQDSGGTNLPVFKAVETDGITPQSITVKPVVIRHPDNLGGYVVYFGTGKYISKVDINTTTDQSFYAIWDKNAVNTSDDGLPLVLASSPVPSATHASGDTNLLRQTVDTTTQTTAGGEFRLTSNNTITWRTLTSVAPHYLGWYMDLPTGEKAISDPVIIDNKVLFISIVPNDNECDFGGDSFIMEADIRSGGRLATSPFDVDGDGLACGCTTDTLSGNVPTGTKIKGIVKGVAILSGGGGGGGGGPRKIFYDPVTKKPKSIKNDEQGTKQRQSWKQLR